MALRVKLNYDEEIKAVAKELGIEGYSKVRLGLGVRCYIKSTDEYVRAIVVNDKLKPNNGCVPVFKLDFDRKMFMYKDTESIAACIERVGEIELTRLFSTSIEALMTVGVNAVEYGSMSGHTFEVPEELGFYSMICVQSKQPIDAKTTGLLVCTIYPLSKEEFDSLKEVTTDNRVYMDGVNACMEKLGGRKLGTDFNDYYDFSNYMTDAIKSLSNDDLTRKVVDVARESGEFNVQGGTLRIETAEQLDKIIDIIKDLEGTK